MAHIPSRETEKAKEYWRRQYEEVLITLETSGENAKAALAREAYCEKPAKIDPKTKSGARDAAIWLSVISYLKEHPDETVYFVSGNIHDFGDGTGYPAPMSDDLHGMEDRLFLLASFDKVISRFTEDITVDIENVKGLLADLGHDSLAAIGAAAQAGMKGGLFNGTRIDSGSFIHCSWHDWIIPPSVILRNVLITIQTTGLFIPFYDMISSWISKGEKADSPKVACKTPGRWPFLALQKLRECHLLRGRARPVRHRAIDRFITGGRNTRRTGSAAPDGEKSSGPWTSAAAPIKQRDLLRKSVVGRDPRQLQFDFALWTRQIGPRTDQKRIRSRLHSGGRR